MPDGGAYDGPLGVVSAFAAIDQLRERGFVPARPIAVAAFCRGGGRQVRRGLPGQPAADRRDRPGGGERAARLRRDDAGRGDDGRRAATRRASARTTSCWPASAAYVELHIEQGSALAGLGAAVGIAEGIWPHGRWRLDFTGRADHAGHHPARRPPRPDAAVRRDRAGRPAAAAARSGALATVGKVTAEPGAANAISSSVRAWLDARAPDEATLHADGGPGLREAAGTPRRSTAWTWPLRRSRSRPVVDFDPGLRDRLRPRAGRGRDAPRPCCRPAPVMTPGVLAARLPTAMLFVRNPTGVSHSPAEHAEPADCEAGVTALAAVLADLAGR